MSIFNEVLGEAEIEIDCPDCAKNFKIQLNQARTTVTCPHCGVEIKIETGNDFLSDARDALDELEKTLDSF